MSRSNRLMGFLGVLMLVGSSLVLANIAQVKVYKEAFPEEKPKCAACHTDALPKKDSHALNAYGEKVVALSATPTAETYKQAGKA